MPRRRPHPVGRPGKKSTAESNTIYFYRPNDEPYGVFCQWHPSPISVKKETLNSLDTLSSAKPPPSTILSDYDESLSFTCAEQFYMFCKALFFSDASSCSRIYINRDPKEQKALGQRVKGFNEYKWTRVKSQVVRMVNWYKFLQNPDLWEVLRETGQEKERELAEASPTDRVWGIGFSVEDAEENRQEWGENRLGKALMSVRWRLRCMHLREAEGLEAEWDWDGAEIGDELANETHHSHSFDEDRIQVEDEQAKDDE